MIKKLLLMLLVVGCTHATGRYNYSRYGPIFISHPNVISSYFAPRNARVILHGNNWTIRYWSPTQSRIIEIPIYRPTRPGFVVVKLNARL